MNIFIESVVVKYKQRVHVIELERLKDRWHALYREYMEKKPSAISLSNDVPDNIVRYIIGEDLVVSEANEIKKFSEKYGETSLPSVDFFKKMIVGGGSKTRRDFKDNDEFLDYVLGNVSDDSRVKIIEFDNVKIDFPLIYDVIQVDREDRSKPLHLARKSDLPSNIRTTMPRIANNELWWPRFDELDLEII